MGLPGEIVALFNLPEAAPPLSNSSHCSFFVEYLTKFCGYTSQNLSVRPWISAADLHTLTQGVLYLNSTASDEGVVWFPEYGCALMKCRAGCTSGMMALNLIAPDAYCFDTSSKVASGGYDYVDRSHPTDYEVLHVGQLSCASFAGLQSTFDQLLQHAQRLKGDKRTSAGGKQGHQKTPAFVHALYREAFIGTPQQLPRGGFSDVGLHTGGQQRDTAWPLVCSSLHEVLLRAEGIDTGPGLLMKKMMAYLGLFACEESILHYAKTVKPSKPTSNAPDELLEHAFRILRSASIKAAALSDEGLDMKHFIDWSESIRDANIDEALSRSAVYSQSYSIPKTDADTLAYENFRFKIPPPYFPSKDNALGSAKIHDKIHANSGWTHLFDGQTLSDIEQWLRNRNIPVTMLSSQADSSSFVALRAVERFMLGLAMDLTRETSQVELDRLLFVVDHYRDILHAFKSSENCQYIPAAELKSRELLILWIGECR